MAVFFWILLGLTWLGGVISMLTENFNISVKEMATFKIRIPQLCRPKTARRSIKNGLKSMPHLGFIRTKVLSSDDVRSVNLLYKVQTLNSVVNFLLVLRNANCEFKSY